MSHYDPSEHDVKLRCDGDHEWGEPYLLESNTHVTLDDGDVYLTISWVVAKHCQNDHTNDIPTTTRTCQRETVVERERKSVPVEALL